MADPALPASLAAELADLRRRLDAVERSPRLPNSSIRGGALTILDDAGDIVAQVGDFVGPDGAPDTGLHFPNDRVGMSQEHGLFRPRLQVEARTLNVTQNTTSGTFSTLWQFVTRSMASGVEVTFACATDAATSAELRLEVIRSGGGTSYSAVKTVPASNPSTYFTWLLDLRAITNPVTIGQPLFLNVQARRTGGAGTVYVFQPPPMVFGHAVEIGATGSGV